MKRVLLMFVVLAVGALAPAAHASLSLQLIDGASSVLIVDGDADGVVSYNGTVGGWTVNITSGVSKPTIGGTTSPQLDLGSLNVSGRAGTLTIMLTDTDFQPNPAWNSTTLESRIGGTTQGTVWLDQIVDEGNALFPQLTDAELSVSLGAFSGGAFSGTGYDYGPLVSGPFSITEIAVITHTAAGQITSFDAHSTVVPVPGAILLGLLGLGVAGVKLRRFA